MQTVPIDRTASPNRRLYTQIAGEIAGLISSGAFPPGVNLPAERELAARLGVSRSSVREAVIALEVMGMVDVRVGNGVRVLPRAATLQAGQTGSFEARFAALPRVQSDPLLPVTLDLDAEIPPFSLLQARRVVEPQTARLAAIHADNAERAAITEAFELNRADNRDGSSIHLGDRLFHIRIAQASGNAAYEVLLTLLLGHRYGFVFQRMQRLYAPADMPDRSEREHEAVLVAILAQDPDAAEAAMAQHLDSVITIFSREIKEEEEPAS